MSTLIRRRSNPVAEMLNWLQADPPLPVRGFGLAPYIRVEDLDLSIEARKIPVQRAGS